MLTGVSVCDRIEILGMNLGEPPRRVGDMASRTVEILVVTHDKHAR